MTTPSHVFRTAVLEALSAVHPQPLRLSDVYDAVEQVVAFDAADLEPISVRGERLAEPAWKRNVRNVLQHAKREGTLVNIAHEKWRLPTPDPQLRLEENCAWEMVRNAAEKALRTRVVYRSTKQERRYRLAEVTSGRLGIERLDSPGPRR